MTNTFYIALNIIFDLATGETRNVLMLVNKQEDASIFSATEAQTYKNFVGARAPRIIWEIEQLPPPTTTPPFFLRKIGSPPATDRFIIKGVTYA
jgi:hypothetical protein